jgi:hypothetical protein
MLRCAVDTDARTFSRSSNNCASRSQKLGLLTEHELARDLSRTGTDLFLIIRKSARSWRFLVVSMFGFVVRPSRRMFAGWFAGLLGFFFIRRLGLTAVVFSLCHGNLLRESIQWQAGRFLVHQVTWWLDFVKKLGPQI